MHFIIILKVVEKDIFVLQTKRMIRLLLLFLLLIGAFSGYNQNLFFEELNNTNGSSTSVHGIAKDSLGYIWFGSWDGLFSSITPAKPGNGLIWDSSLLESYGIISVVKGTGVERFELSDIRVYPNPVIDELYIRNTSGLNISSIQVKNISGQVVIDNINHEADYINFNTLSPGIILLRYNQNRECLKQKLLNKTNYDAKY